MYIYILYVIYTYVYVLVLSRLVFCRRCEIPGKPAAQHPQQTYADTTLPSLNSVYPDV